MAFIPSSLCVPCHLWNLLHISVCPASRFCLAVVFTFLCFYFQTENLLMDADKNIKIAGESYLRVSSQVFFFVSSEKNKSAQ